MTPSAADPSPAGSGGLAGSAAAPSERCPSCQALVSDDLPFCGKCGARITQVKAVASCSRCGRVNPPDLKFCPACGNSLPGGGAVAVEAGTGGELPRAEAGTVHLALLDRKGGVVQRFGLVNAITSLGRSGADINFPDDLYLSPVHAQFVYVDGVLSVRDLGSKNGSWVFIEEPHRLMEGDLVLMGSQILRYRRLGYPGPRPPEPDQTRRLGSHTPAADIANLAQIRSDGSARDIMHLSPGHTIRIGREQGDWQFPYDSSMSGLHALIRSEDADFVVVDAGSRNGVAVAIRGEKRLVNDQRLLIGDQMLLVEIT